MVEPTHLKKYAQVKLDHLPRVRGENRKNIFETTIQIQVKPKQKILSEGNSASSDL